MPIGAADFFLVDCDSDLNKFHNNKQMFLKSSRKLPITVRNNFLAENFPKSKIY